MSFFVLYGSPWDHVPPALLWNSYRPEPPRDMVEWAERFVCGDRHPFVRSPSILQLADWILSVERRLNILNPGEP